MNFKQATDRLFARVDHDELAKALGVSVPSIRQARLDATAHAHRQPPEGWRAAVTQLAERRMAHYKRLVEDMNGHEDKRKPTK